MSKRSQRDEPTGGSWGRNQNVQRSSSDANPSSPSRDKAKPGPYRPPGKKDQNDGEANMKGSRSVGERLDHKTGNKHSNGGKSARDAWCWAPGGDNN
jgi:hypothetical protein